MGSAKHDPSRKITCIDLPASLDPFCTCSCLEYPIFGITVEFD